MFSPSCDRIFLVFGGNIILLFAIMFIYLHKHILICLYIQTLSMVLFTFLRPEFLLEDITSILNFLKEWEAEWKWRKGRWSIIAYALFSFGAANAVSLCLCDPKRRNIYLYMERDWIGFTQRISWEIVFHYNGYNLLISYIC